MVKEPGKHCHRQAVKVNITSKKTYNHGATADVMNQSDVTPLVFIPIKHYYSQLAI